MEDSNSNDDEEEEEEETKSPTTVWMTGRKVATTNTSFIAKIVYLAPVHAYIAIDVDVNVFF